MNLEKKVISNILDRLHHLKAKLNSTTFFSGNWIKGEVLSLYKLVDERGENIINLTGDLKAFTGEMTVSATQVSFFSLKAPPPRVLVRFSISFGVLGVSDDCGAFSFPGVP